MTFPEPSASLEVALDGLGIRPPVAARRVVGGDINKASVLEDSRGSRVFLKEHSTLDPEHFAAEFDGLQALGRFCNQKVRGPRSPRPLAYGRNGAKGTFLLLEYIEPGRGPRSGDWFKVGRDLGEFYLDSVSEAPNTYGYSRSNRIGSTVQINGPEQEWGVFFARARIGHLRRLLTEQGSWSPASAGQLLPQLMQIEDHLPFLLPPRPLKVLVHGDLWRGNLMFDTEGLLVLFDPAVYWGTPEADRAMAELFGGFPPDFFRGLVQITQTSDDPRGRQVYQLYHLLNHLLLFGSSYLGQVRSTVSGLLKT